MLPYTGCLVNHNCHPQEAFKKVAIMPEKIMIPIALSSNVDLCKPMQMHRLARTVAAHIQTIRRKIKKIKTQRQFRSPSHNGYHPEIPAQFENQASELGRRIIIYENAPFLDGSRDRKISSVACGFSLNKVHEFVNIINEVYVFTIKYRSAILY